VSDPTTDEWVAAIKTALKGIMAPETPAQHKHGLMGTNPNVRSSDHTREDAIDVIEGRHPGGMKAYGIPSYDDKMKKWYETGQTPWPMKAGAPLVPVTSEMIDAMAVRRHRYWAARRKAREARWRIERAWAVIRHGYDDYYDS
jgi:hypothetical protein